MIGDDICSGSQLECIETFVHSRLGFGGQRSKAEVPSSIESDTVSNGAAEQFVNGQVIGFTGHIPKRLLDAAGGARCHNPTAPPKKALHLLPGTMDLSRILTD